MKTDLTKQRDSLVRIWYEICSPNDVRGPIRGVSLPKSLHHGEVKHPGSALVFLVEILSRPSNNLGPLREVFSRKHRVHCLKAVPGYWCKIAKHCKQILSPVIANCSIHAHCSTWKESNVTGTFHSISSRSFTRADENRSSIIEIGLGYRRPGSV